MCPNSVLTAIVGMSAVTEKEFSGGWAGRRESQVSLLGRGFASVGF